MIYLNPWQLYNVHWLLWLGGGRSMAVWWRPYDGYMMAVELGLTKPTANLDNHVAQKRALLWPSLDNLGPTTGIQTGSGVS